MRPAVPALVLLLGLFTIASSQNACVTPNGETARCISVYQCKVFIDALTNRTSETIRFLRDSRCGYDTDPLVCCGSVARYQSVATPPPGPTTPTASTGSPPPLPADKLNLLPARNQCGQQLTTERIFEGNATEIDEFPWMVLLEYKDRRGRSVGHSCGGMLINDRYVLTAAHCVVGEITRQVGELFQVRLGEWDKNTETDCVTKGEFEDCAPPHQDIAVEQAIVHPGYVGDVSRYDDIGLVRLVRPANTTGTYKDFVRPICLPTGGERSAAGSNLTVAGWGYTEKGIYSPVKLKVSLQYVESAQCENTFRTQFQVQLTRKQMCAGGVGRKDSCTGDSGGPLMRTFPGQTQWYAEGIVSFGTECGTDGVPGVYTRISEYMDWILQNLRP